MFPTIESIVHFFFSIISSSQKLSSKILYKSPIRYTAIVKTKINLSKKLTYVSFSKISKLNIVLITSLSSFENILSALESNISTTISIGIVMKIPMITFLIFSFFSFDFSCFFYYTSYSFLKKFNWSYD